MIGLAIDAPSDELNVRLLTSVPVGPRNDHRIAPSLVSESKYSRLGVA
jgi:hypothetical protein